jgi:hypothetical protein
MPMHRAVRKLVAEHHQELILKQISRTHLNTADWAVVGLVEFLASRVHQDSAGREDPGESQAHGAGVAREDMTITCQGNTIGTSEERWHRTRRKAE